MVFTNPAIDARKKEKLKEWEHVEKKEIRALQPASKFLPNNQFSLYLIKYLESHKNITLKPKWQSTTKK